MFLEYIAGFYEFSYPLTRNSSRCSLFFKRQSIQSFSSGQLFPDNIMPRPRRYARKAHASLTATLPATLGEEVQNK